MNWYKESKSKSKFDYKDEYKCLWTELINSEMDRCNIRFNLENDDLVSSRMIDLDYHPRDLRDRKYRLYAELYEAGGDWECPNLYFRCQIFDKTDYFNHIKKKKIVSRYYPGEKFIFIPLKNLNLQKSKNSGYVANDENTCHDMCKSIKDIKLKDIWILVKREAEKRLRNMFSKNSDEETLSNEELSRSLLNNWKTIKDDGIY